MHEEDNWTIAQFAQSNPVGPGQGDVAALLRRVAETLDRLGEIIVLDITFHREPMPDEDRLLMAVYYDRPDDD
jgi:hypothetical protein